MADHENKDFESVWLNNPKLFCCSDIQTGYYCTVKLNENFAGTKIDDFL